MAAWRDREKGRGNSGREASATGLPEKGKAKGRVWSGRVDMAAVRVKVREREVGQGTDVSHVEVSTLQKIVHEATG